MSKKTDQEIYEEAQKQDELSKKLDPKPRAVEQKPQAMTAIEGMLNSKNPV